MWHDAHRSVGLSKGATSILLVADFLRRPRWNFSVLFPLLKWRWMRYKRWYSWQQWRQPRILRLLFKWDFEAISYSLNNDWDRDRRSHRRNTVSCNTRREERWNFSNSTCDDAQCNGEATAKDRVWSMKWKYRDTFLHRYAADCISSPERSERFNKATHSFLRESNGDRTTVSIVQLSAETLYSVDTDTALRMSVSICKHTRHYICTPMLPYVDIFLHMYIHLHIATVNCVLSDMYTVWLFFYHIFSEYIMPVYLCVLICVYIYVCIYTCHLHTTLTCILPCILAHNFLRILKHSSTLTHSFQCWLFTVCVSCYALICIRLCLCLCLYAMTASVPVLSIFFHCIHIFS